MSLYVDASAFVKRHAPHEPHHDECLAVMRARTPWMTSRITYVEASRGLARAAGLDAVAVLASLDADIIETAFVDVDHGVISLARSIALETGVKTLDALHLASAKRIPDPDLEFLTFDRRQSQAAESLGLRLARPTAD